MEFEVFKLLDIVDFNPPRPLVRGKEAPFLEMAAIPESSREVE